MGSVRCDTYLRSVGFLHMSRDANKVAHGEVIQHIMLSGFDVGHMIGGSQRHMHISHSKATLSKAEAKQKQPWPHQDQRWLEAASDGTLLVSARDPNWTRAGP